MINLAKNAKKEAKDNCKNMKEEQDLKDRDGATQSKETLGKNITFPNDYYF